VTPGLPGRPQSSAQGIVAASHPLAAEAGAQLLRAGGNAVDAAAAVQFALTAVEPLASGIGGGGFMLVHLASGETTCLDYRECAPAAATADQFLGSDGTVLPWEQRCTSGLAVGVPGTVAGLAHALARWGSLGLARALEPAIRLAEAELPASRFLTSRLGEEYQAKLRLDPAAAATFLPTGRPLSEGQPLHQPGLARALRLLAERGPSAFYDGEIGAARVGAVRARGGRIAPADLTGYRSVERKPLRGRFLDVELQTMPPPGAGVALLQLLALLEPLDPAALGQLTAERAHLELQAMRLALLDRAAYLADPAYDAVPEDALLDPGYVAKRRALITTGPLERAPAAGALERASPPSPRPAERGETTHFVAADRWGNLVTCTGTLEDFYGSGIVVPGYGFLLNNELTDFAAQPGGANQVRPGARPASSMVPTLVTRGSEPWLALGSPGGPTIVTAVAQVLLRVLADHLPLQAAVDAPRYFARPAFPRFTWERGLPAETLSRLEALGHQPSGRPTTIGSVQALMRDEQTGRWIGAADPRRHGTVVEID
jgi:gamma-glutamyltranspeptidase/glutathione hydrolase